MRNVWCELFVVSWLSSRAALLLDSLTAVCDAHPICISMFVVGWCNVRRGNVLATARRIPPKEQYPFEQGGSKMGLGSVVDVPFSFYPGCHHAVFFLQCVDREEVECDKHGDGCGERSCREDFMFILQTTIAVF